jgi:hypothetical protein
LQPAGLYLGITAKSGGPTAPIYTAGHAVTTPFTAAPVGGEYDLTISATQPETELNLLWGSADDGNKLALLDDGTTVATLTGKQILASVAGTAAAGGIGGTWSFYVAVSLPSRFDEVQASTTTNWFETTSLGTTSVAVGTQSDAEAIAEPSGIGLFALLSLIAVRGRHRGNSISGL